MEDMNIHSMIKERFAKLPPKLQAAITSTEIADKLRAVSQKYHLLLDQGQILENETYMVLLGVEQAEKYEGNLKRELKIPSEDARKIANDVAKDVFLPIRDTLKESTTIETGKQTMTTPPPTPPISELDNQVTTQTPTTAQDKLESVVKNQNKEVEIVPAKQYSVDPYREPIE